MTIALVLSLAYLGALVGSHALPVAPLEREHGMSGAPVVACEGLAPEWVDDAHVWAAEWWAPRGCIYPAIERGPCLDTCGGLPCRRGAVSVIARPRTMEDQPVELTHRLGTSWAVVELPERPVAEGSRARPSDHGALVLAHALGHACGVPDDVRRGGALPLSPEGQVMSPLASSLGWGDDALGGGE